MAYWRWEEVLETGVDPIDREHRYILNQMNLLASPGVANSPALTQRQIRKLVIRLKACFAMEEELMATAGYGLLEVHRQAHRDILARLMVHQYNQDLGSEINAKVSSELGVWLTRHVPQEDGDYGPCVNDHLNPGWLRRLFSRVRPAEHRL